MLTKDAMSEANRERIAKPAGPKPVRIPARRSLERSDPANAVSITKDEVDRWAETGELPTRIETWLASSPLQKDTKRVLTRSELSAARKRLAR
jgi:hypothetical protein